MRTPLAPSRQPVRPAPHAAEADEASHRGIGWLLIMLVMVPMFATPFVIAAIVLLNR